MYFQKNQEFSVFFFRGKAKKHPPREWGGCSVVDYTRLVSVALA